MGTDMSGLIQVRHPEHGWVCTGVDLSVDRNYDLFSLLGTDLANYHPGLPDDGCKCPHVQFRHESIYPQWNTLPELENLFTDAKGYAATGLQDLMQQIRKAKPRADVMGDWEPRDEDMRIIYYFWR
jgi:hypothetical protein